MSRKPKFTLIEMLVILGIIAVLAALLLPGLRRARERASRIQCRSNLRQQGVAVATYISDYDAEFPLVYPHGQGAWYPTPQTNTGVWAEMEEYAGAWKAYLCPQFHSQGYANARQGGGYYSHLLNPSWMWPGDYLLQKNAGSLGWLGYCTYWWWSDPTTRNPWKRVDVDLADEYREYEPWGALYLVADNNKVTHLRSSPSELTVRVEAYPAYGGWPGWDGRTFDELGGNARHLGTDGHPEGGNLLFADGRVEWSPLWGPVTNDGTRAGLPWDHQVQTHSSAPPKVEGLQPLSW